MARQCWRRWDWPIGSTICPTSFPAGSNSASPSQRALINEPSIILADEPTGNLDSRSGQEVMGILQRLNRERGITVILVTHDPRIAGYADRILHIFDGLIERDEAVANPANAVGVEVIG